MEVEEILFDIADALRVPVLVLAIVALAYVLFELGGLVAELIKRRGRSRIRLDQAVISAGAALGSGDSGRAYLELGKVATSKSMRGVLGSVVEHRSAENGADRIAKDLAEFDYSSVKRLERTRILVRVGPALGLMGTLIPLSPALAGLAAGDVETLTDNLRVAFSVTVAGLLVGSIAFAISLVRDRLYGQDYSDLEYVASALAPGTPLPTQTLAATTQVTPRAAAAPTVATPAAAPTAAPAATPAPAPRPPAPPAQPVQPPPPPPPTQKPGS
jgi:biopolymer transport protein ExbB/TolQ